MITIRNLRQIDSEKSLLEIPALDLRAGEMTAFVGEIGSGISELFKVLVGKLRPTFGEVQVLGMDPHRELDRLKDRIGILNLENQLYERFSVRANLELHCRLYGQPAENVAEALESVGLRDHAEVRVDRLSDSLARRLALARCLAHRPNIFYLFQPTLGCDQATISIFADVLVELAEKDRTVLIFDHAESNLMKVCTNVYRLDQGRLVQDAPDASLAWQAASFKIPVKQDGRIALLDPSKILYIAVEGEQTFIFTSEGGTASHLNIGDLEKRLANKGFFRAHRGYLVNLQYVNAVIPYTRDSFTLTLDNTPPVEIPLSKKSAQKLRRLLDY